MNLDQIKLCVFDVDGVLVNSRLLHYPATMFALKDHGYLYTREEDENFGSIYKVVCNKLIHFSKGTSHMTEACAK